MNKEVIEDIGELLKGSFKETDRFPLHELLWTIDAKHHLIPSIDELNEAIKKNEGIIIETFDNEIYLVLTKESNSEKITQEHIDTAILDYQKILKKFLK